MQPLLITDEPINVGDLIDAARREEAGALAIFVGTVRNHSNDKNVSAIDYSAYRPMAESVLETIRRECAQRSTSGGSFFPRPPVNGAEIRQSGAKWQAPAFQLSRPNALRDDMRCAHIHRAHTSGSGGACACFRLEHALWHAHLPEAVA